jgi:diketogulonate reductase-like aldo/keto reductase
LAGPACRAACKSVTPARIRQNIDPFDFTLDEDQMRQLNRLATGERIGPDPDTFNAFNVSAG